MCYEVPHFVAEENESRSITDYAQIIICLLIFALLGYVVFRSTRSEKVVEELQPEISVEALLESTAEAQEIEDIVKADSRILDALNGKQIVKIIVIKNVISIIMLMKYLKVSFVLLV